MDIGVYDTVKKLLDGEFKGGTTTKYGLNEGLLVFLIQLKT